MGAALPAIINQDLPIIIDVTILSSALVVAAILVVGPVQAPLDPRVRVQERQSTRTSARSPR